MKKKKRDELFGFMEAYDNDDLPDGAWWATLESSVEEWNSTHKTNLDPFMTVHQYLARNDNATK